MSTDLAEDSADTMQQTRIPAAGAALPQNRAPNSVFAVGGDAGVPPTGDDQLERARQTFAACGELSRLQLQEALECSMSTATRLINTLVNLREVSQLRKDGVVPIYGAPQASTGSGFKAWLSRKAEATAEPQKPAAKRRARKAKAMPPTKPAAAAKAAKPTRRPRKPRAAAPAPAPAAALPAVLNRGAIVAAGLVPITAPVDDLQLGFFSDGAIAIETSGQQLRLTPAQSRRLIDWVLRVDALMSVGI